MKSAPSFSRKCPETCSEGGREEGGFSSLATKPLSEQHYLESETVFDYEEYLYSFTYMWNNSVPSMLQVCVR